ncbi:MAG TPA: SusD/RagB family nutrient-binding outer membrane lipoprotein [Lacibacter sp.]|nr:SusD/RagB family nutrient-binding outer membrane lipoprotein [Lacibacter sp.]HMO88375.1 SusD/RagB family nutrient-binding outer membrane lipoprotein [Lacibacter sp.]HMP86365.1 SusD/RagB family nutrient-binding outer membrane lipoprotein [Lacibacter sp.]
MKHATYFSLRKIAATACVLLLLSAGAGCKKYLDINTDPNRPTEPSINGLLATVTQNTGLNVFRAANITGYYVQYLASPNASSPTDIYDRVDFSATWRLMYDVMADVYDLEQQAIKLNSTAHLGISKILMAVNLSMLTNMWGDVPFSEALTGTNLKPGYDNAQQLYSRCLTLLDEGISELRKAPTVTMVPAADFFHGPTLANATLWNSTARVNWIRTAYALRARLLNQVSKLPSYNAAAVLSAVDSAYTGMAQEARVTVFPLRNPWATVARNNAALVLDGWLSSNVVDLMNGTRLGYPDPRLPRLTNLTRFGDYRGTRNGAGRVGTGTTNDECYLVLAGHYSADAAPLYVATFEEMKFIEAEAALRANQPTRAYTAYLAGITAHMNKLGVAAADRDAYLARPQVGVGASNLTLSVIAREKYFATFLQPVAWDDARRFNYNLPGFQLPLNALLTQPIRRLDYPGTEQSLNSGNPPVVGALTDRLWWDQ